MSLQLLSYGVVRLRPLLLQYFWEGKIRAAVVFSSLTFYCSSSGCCRNRTIQINYCNAAVRSAAILAYKPNINVESWANHILNSINTRAHDYNSRVGLTILVGLIGSRRLNELSRAANRAESNELYKNRPWKKSTFPPPTFTKVCFSSLNSKTGQITSLNFSNRAFYLPGAVSKAALLQ
jgi:hypothetical protein